MALWHKKDSVKKLSREEEEKRGLMGQVAELGQRDIEKDLAITELELGDIEKDLAITELELSVLGMQAKMEMEGE